MKTIKRITRIITLMLTALLALILLFHVALYIKRAATDQVCPTVCGLTSAVVISGSMAPEINVNDYVLAVAQKEYEPGQTIIYAGKTRSVTHKLQSVYTDENGQKWAIAQGIANNTADDPIPYEAIVGRIILVIPGVGSLQEFFAKPTGFLILTLAVVALLLLPELLRFLQPRGKSS